MMAQALSVLAHFYRQVHLSVTDFDFYRQIYKQPTGRTVAYLALILFHSGALGTVYLAVFWLPKAVEFTHWLLDNAPPMQVRQGKLEVDAELPLLLRHPSPNGPSFVFARTIEDPLPAYQPPVFILAHEGLHILGESAQPLPWDYFLQDASSNAEIRQRIGSLALLALPMFFAIVILPMAFLIPIEALIFSLFGYSAAARFKRRLPFRYHLNIAVYGLTPAVLIDLLGKSLGLGGSLIRILYVITAGIYIFAATNKILARKQE
ncbi:MAG: DUF1189 family protein [Acidobacteriota bacterium]